MSEYKFSYNCFYRDGLGAIFQQKSFLDLHKENDEYFYFEYLKVDRVIANIYFCKTINNLWRSPLRGTFSGLYFDENVTLQELSDFMTQVEDVMETYSAASLEILVPPLAHQSSLNSRQIYLLHSLNYIFTHCDLNYSLRVDTRSYIDRLSDGNKKRLRKCHKNNFEALLLPLEKLSEVYKVIEINRSAKDYRLTMTLNNLEEMTKKFGKETYLFGVNDPQTQELIASAVCFRIYPDMLYVFYWGDLPGYSNFSPVVALAESIYDFCQTNAIKVLDIGTATENKTPNYGLITFKKNLGFEESLKFRMVKDL